MNNQYYNKLNREFLTHVSGDIYKNKHGQDQPYRASQLLKVPSTNKEYRPKLPLSIDTTTYYERIGGAGVNACLGYCIKDADGLIYSNMTGVNSLDEKIEVFINWLKKPSKQYNTYVYRSMQAANEMLERITEHYNSKDEDIKNLMTCLCSLQDAEEKNLGVNSISWCNDTYDEVNAGYFGIRDSGHSQRLTKNFRLKYSEARTELLVRIKNTLDCLTY